MHPVEVMVDKVILVHLYYNCIGRQAIQYPFQESLRNAAKLRKEGKIMLKRFMVIVSVTFMLTAAIAAAWEPEFKEQDIDKATEECDDPSPCKPELVATMDDNGNINLALLRDAQPNVDSLLPGWCPARHCTEYLNDGFYNNCRSWISATSPGAEAWAEIDLGRPYQVKKVGFGSDHCGNYQDRAAKDFKILVATSYDEDSEAASWKVVYDNEDGDPAHTTVYFEFDEVEARYVRISVLNGVPAEVRIDEIEIYSGALAVNHRGKLAIYWGQVKSQH
jgi:hypothetical protein